MDNAENLTSQSKSNAKKKALEPNSKASSLSDLQIKDDITARFPLRRVATKYLNLPPPKEAGGFSPNLDKYCSNYRNERANHANALRF